jgi:hypothetical protein
MSLLEDYLTRDELATELGVVPRTIMRYQNLPNGLPYLEIAGRIYYRRESVRDWLHSRERRPNPRRVGA